MPIYMKYGSITGDVTEQGHIGWIELMSAQLGAHRHATAVGSATGSSSDRTGASLADEVVVTKLSDSATTSLFRESLSGQGAHVDIDFMREGDVTFYLKLILENTLISSYSVSGHGGDSHSTPMESLSLNFTKIEYKTRPSQTTP